MLDISENSLAIYDISTNKIPTLKPDISKNTVDISQNKADISKNTVDISQNTDDIEDISANKIFIQNLQSVDYCVLLANTEEE